MTSRQSSSPKRALFDGAGKARDLARSIDWSATPLGSPATWSSSLRATTRLCMASKTPMAIWAGPDLTLIHNDAYAPVLGSKFPSAMGRPMREVFDEFFDEDAPLLREVLEEGNSVRRENEPYLLRQNGGLQERYFTFSLTPIQEDDARIIGMLAVISETTSAVRERAAREEYFSFALASAGVGAWDLDLTDHSAERNLEHDRIFGYDELLPEWTYEDFLEHVVAEDRAQVDRAFREALEAKGTWDFECRIVRRDGELRWIAARGRRRSQESGQDRMTGVVLDISERKAAEEELREANRRKNEYLAMLGHELRNPLAAIQTASELVKHDRAEPSTMERAVDVLERQTEHMVRLVDGLLDISRIARGKIDLEPVTLDLREVVDGVLIDRTAQSAERELEVESELPTEPVWVRADRVRMTQIVDNLVGNSIKFTPAPGTIHVRLGAEDGQARISVRDTGIGIQSGELSRVFEPFHQKEQQGGRKSGGLGLGLAVAKELVQLHGGSIEAHSPGVGRGAEFVVRIPLAEAPVVSKSRPHDLPTASKRVLIVEDNEDVAEMLGMLLELKGHEVDVAPTGDRGLEMLRKDNADLVLCDIGLPGMSGYEFARAVRADQDLHGLALVALTGYGEPNARQRSADAGFDAHLTKPVDVDRLAQVLDEC